MLSKLMKTDSETKTKTKMASTSKNRVYSIVEYFGGNDGYKCGYCKSTNTNFSHGMWAHSLSVQDYQALIDRGWRRSGQYIYKPTMHLTCCPMYTISCSALDFNLTKSQKKIIKRMNKFLISGDRKPDKDISMSSEMETEDVYVNINEIHDLKEKSHLVDKEASNAEVKSVHPSCITSIPDVLATGEHTDKCKDSSSEISNVVVKGESSTNLVDLNKAVIKSGEGADANKPVCKKAKLLRLERKKEKLLSKGLSEEEIVNKLNKKVAPSGKSLEDLINEPSAKPSVHKLKIRLVHANPANAEFKATFDRAYEIYQKYQMTIHEDPPSKCSQKQYTRFLVNSPLQTVLVASDSPEMKRTLSTSWKVFVSYQTKIHKETPNECNMETYLDFLVHTPLKLQQNSNSPTSGYGSFHQQYWLDDKLIAVGVIDILPKCVSSVYFYYDPEYSDLSLGTYASLREVSFTRGLHNNAPSIKFYYMGFYIESCVKMRYKGRLKPSFLLCPETYTWHALEEARIKLQKSKYSRLNDDINATDAEGNVDIDKVLVLYHNICMDYKTLRIKKKTTFDEDVVQEYAALVGMNLAGRLLLVRS